VGIWGFLPGRLLPAVLPSRS